MSLRIHLLDAGRVLDPWRMQIEPLIHDSLAELSDHFDLSDLDVIVYPSTQSIPELGVNGFAESGHLLHLKLDVSNRYFASQHAQAIPALLAHEVHHCMRDRTVGYGETLAQALVSEGLACAFERQVTGRLPAYATALSDTQLDEWLQRALPHLHSPSYDHASWFFGNPRAGIPRHCGYSLGYAQVDSWMKKKGCTAGAAVDVPATAFWQPGEDGSTPPDTSTAHAC